MNQILHRTFSFDASIRRGEQKSNGNQEGKISHQFSTTLSNSILPLQRSVFQIIINKDAFYDDNLSFHIFGCFKEQPIVASV